MHLIGLFDKKAEKFINYFPAPTLLVCVRSLLDNSEIRKYLNDFYVADLGEFNDDNGNFMPNIDVAAFCNPTPLVDFLNVKCSVEDVARVARAFKKSGSDSFADWLKDLNIVVD